MELLTYLNDYANGVAGRISKHISVVNMGWTDGVVFVYPSTPSALLHI